MGEELDKTMAALKKKYGPAVTPGTDLKILEIQRIPTGSLALDVEMGGGYPAGRIIELFGKEGSTKSSLALYATREVQKLGKPAVWIDAEGTFDPTWAALIGVDLKRITVMRPDKGEDAVDMLQAVVKTNEIGIVVLDSVAALMPSDDLEKSATESTRMASPAQLVGSAVKKLQAALNAYDVSGGYNQCLVILLNQIRERPGVLYGSPEYTPGGNAIKFFASVRVRLAKGEWIEEEGPSGKEKIGHVVRFNIVKNKTAPPFKESEFAFYTSGSRRSQIDSNEEIVRYGKLYDLVRVNGSVFSHGALKAQGKANFVKLLEANPKVLDALRKEVLQLANRNT